MMQEEVVISLGFDAAGENRTQFHEVSEVDITQNVIAPGRQ